MRKILICFVLIIAIFLCYSIVSEGLTIGDITIANYTQVGNASKEVDTLIGQLTNLNGGSLTAKKSEIKSAIADYKNKKSEYESMKEVMLESIKDVDETTMVDMYDIDFLWTIIGNFATEEGVNLKMDLVRSSLLSGLDTTADYTMCDMKFTLTGDYIAITELVYDIEDDERLGFEISEFEMAKGGDNLMATFTVKGVPINNRTLTSVQTSIGASISEMTSGSSDSADGSGSSFSSSITNATSNALQKTGDSLSTGRAIN